MKVKHRALLTIVMVFLPSVILSSLVLIPEEVSAYTPHNPIRIDGDGEFTAPNGVTGGSGSPTDPFIIEGWEINASADRGIFIINTQAHFYIRDVYVHSGSMDTPENDGISIQHSENGRIENCSLSHNQMGISVSGSKIAIRNNTFTSNGVAVSGRTLEEARTNIVTSDNMVNGRPIHFHKDGTELVIIGGSMGQLLILNYTNVRVSSLYIDHTSSGISIAYAENVIVDDNEITNSTIGISLSMVTNAGIYSNMLYNNGAGITAAYLDNSTVAGNTVALNSYCGIILDKTNDSFVRNNHIYENHAGLCIEHTRNVTIAYNTIEDNEYGVAYDAPMSMLVHHNNFIDNTIQVNPRIGTWNSWDDDYPSGGNYWSDYDGVDVKRGPSQDEPGSDFIGDTPYAIDSDTQDRYPQMTWLWMNGWTWNERPTCLITKPKNDQTISGVYRIYGVASDPDETVPKVEIRIDYGDFWEVEGGSSWSFEWDTRSTWKGEHTIYVRAYDGYAYSDWDTVWVNVDNTTIWEDDWTYVSIALLMVILAVIGMVIFIIVKRKKKPPEFEEINEERNDDEVRA